MTIKVGILGLGTVGAAFYQLLDAVPDVAVVAIAVRDLNKPRDIKDQSLLTDDPNAVVNNPDCDIIVEVMGGIDPVYDLVATALKSGKQVVTANKALLAEKGAELFALAAEHQTALFFEAAVAGSIPIINTLQTHLASDEITSIEGILNGTSHYILSEMAEKQIDFDEALAEASAKGYAEADPSHDIKLTDAAHKLALLIRLAYKKEIDWQTLSCKGIKHVRYLDMVYAEQFGYTIKPVAQATRVKGTEDLVAHVEPMLVSQEHLLCACSGVMNAVTVESKHCDTLAFMGPGAGAMPTATSVFADFMRACRQERLDLAVKPGSVLSSEANPLTSEFYIRLIVSHEVGILARLTQLFSESGISIKAIHQKQEEVGLSENEKLIVILTEAVLDKQIDELAVKLKEDLNFAKQDKLILRII